MCVFWPFTKFGRQNNDYVSRGIGVKGWIPDVCVSDLFTFLVRQEVIGVVALFLAPPVPQVDLMKILSS